MQLKKKAQSSGNAEAASLAQLDEYSSEDSRPVWAPSTTTQLDNYEEKQLLSTPGVCKHRFNLFWWRKMQVDGEQVSCGLSFVLFETRIHATTDANRRAGFLCIFSPSMSHHITFWFHPLLCHYGITMWNMSLVFFVAFIFPIKNLGGIEGGRAGGIKSTFEQIWSAAWWPGLGGRQVSDARTRRKLAQIHENLLWLETHTLQFTVTLSRLCHF